MERIDRADVGRGRLAGLMLRKPLLFATLPRTSMGETRKRPPREPDAGGVPR